MDCVAHDTRHVPFAQCVAQGAMCKRAMCFPTVWVGMHGRGMAVCTMLCSVTLLCWSVGMRNAHWCASVCVCWRGCWAFAPQRPNPFAPHNPNLLRCLEGAIRFAHCFALFWSRTALDQNFVKRDFVQKKLQKILVCWVDAIDWLK